ncbi:MAG: hypothetical protein IT530_21650 [Burkholderiales bacterium]|nr:hypothetical protein [Burkholderiales bacterium]
MRDAITLASSGHPTVVVVHDVFAKAARALARTLGADSLKIHAFPQPVDVASDRAHAHAAALKLVQLFIE